MIEAVFISDLHLHPHEMDITERFNSFIQWAKRHTKCVYILGDFFHAWPGDDALDPWSEEIAKQLSLLASQGVKLYFMPGNRDFLLGERFATLASMTILKEPAVITLGGTNIALVHGDRYCTKDRGHQWLRRLTRNSIFPFLFMRLPYHVRYKLANEVRQRSQNNQSKSVESMDIVTPVMLKHMQQLQVNVLVHGHIHKPGLTTHRHEGEDYHQYVLSDWDDNPLIMCYDSPNGFYFVRLSGE